MAEKMLKITLVKSPIGAVPKHRATEMCIRDRIKIQDLMQRYHTQGFLYRKHASYWMPSEAKT